MRVEQTKVLGSILLGAVSAAILLFAFLRVGYVSGRSMEPLLQDGDLVVALRFPGYLACVKSGDLVLAEPPIGAGGEGGVVVKRVRGIEGGESGPFFQLSGDNSDCSRDSRDYGLIPGSRLRGLVFYPLRGGSKTGSKPAGR